MGTAQWVAVIATMVLAAMTVFHLLLALGAPLGRAAWGGHHRVLPARFRWGSLAAVGVLGTAAWVVMARADLVIPGNGSRLVRVASWILAAYLALNTVANLVSKSPIERAMMTPASVFLAMSFVFMALS